MHERKAEMARQADAFIALPGIFQSAPLVFLIFLHRIYIHGVGTFRRLWNHGGSIRDDHMVPAWNS